LAIDPRQRHLPTPVRAFVDFMRRNARDLCMTYCGFGHREGWRPGIDQQHADGLE